ncbi:MAG: hypothetical protein R3C28_28400 [Pirellulaceae bacterium]
MKENFEFDIDPLQNVIPPLKWANYPGSDATVIDVDLSKLFDLVEAAEDSIGTASLSFSSNSVGTGYIQVDILDAEILAGCHQMMYWRHLIGSDQWLVH